MSFICILVGASRQQTSRSGLVHPIPFACQTNIFICICVCIYIYIYIYIYICYGIACIWTMHCTLMAVAFCIRFIRRDLSTNPTTRPRTFRSRDKLPYLYMCMFACIRDIVICDIHLLQARLVNKPDRPHTSRSRAKRPYLYGVGAQAYVIL